MNQETEPGDSDVGIWGWNLEARCIKSFRLTPSYFCLVRVKAQGPPRPRTPLHKRFSPIPGGPGVVVVGGRSGGAKFSEL